MPKTKTDAYDLKESQIKGEWSSYDDIANWLCTELELAISNRGQDEAEIKYAWALYQQDRTRSRAPWPDAADLTSPFAAEYVDALHARLMTTIFTEPVWTVEGWGQSAPKAPFVEEFHQRAQEDERLQSYADEWALRGFVEGVGTLEISEAFEMRREAKRIRAKLQLDDLTGSPIMGEDDGQPLLQQDETGAFVEAQDPNEPSAEVDIDSLEPVRLGPQYEVVPFLDFLVLPNHARDRRQVWGYAKRTWLRVPELKAQADAGVYDPDAVEKLGDANERATLSDEAPLPRTVTDQRGPTAQKELYSCQLLMDFDGQGERWWRVTVSKQNRTLLRLKRDDRTTRYLRFIPFPKPGSVDRGYSLITNKLITVVEEDTAVRNLFADRAAMAASQPVKRLVGALWDPYEQPIGPRSVIDVRDMREVEPMQGIGDVPASILQWRQFTRQDAERSVGQNDVSIGQETQERRTLGEVQLVAGYAEVRMNVILRRFQETLEELFQARHTIWQRTLSDRQRLPQMRALAIGRDNPGVDVSGLASDGTVTADLLDGIFWGKPKGSVETADLNRQRQDFNQFLQVLAPLMQINPAIAMIMRTIPAAKSLLKTALKVNRVQDVQSILGSEANGVFDQLQQQQELQQNPMMQMVMAMANAAPGMGGGPAALGTGATPASEPSGPPAQQPAGVM